MGIAPATREKRGPRPERKPRKKVTRRVREEYVSHVIRVRDWEFYYSRRAADPKSKWECGPMSEFATLSFVGEIVRPENSKYKSGKLTLSGRAEFVAQADTPALVAIGSATARGEEIEGFVFVPEERLRLLLTVAQSGRVEVAEFRGPKLRYGGGVIQSVSLDTHFDEEEW